MADISFTIPDNYDYEKSSEDNYFSPNAEFVGKYKDIRGQLDYSYHKHYSVERQLFHDKLIDQFLDTVVRDKRKNMVCESPLENWVVFTAGPMGAGKGHTIQWLFSQDLFPLDAFVNVDPDAIRALLPETPKYNEIDNNMTGFLTQKEVGYISEVLSYDALQKGKNVLVDGSLRNAHWYLEYFKNLRDEFPIVKLAILHVTAPPETVLRRASKRALVTGRLVPEELILDSMKSIPESMKVLSPNAEFVATFVNDDNPPEPEPRISYACLQEDGCKSILWTMHEHKMEFDSTANIDDDSIDAPTLPQLDGRPVDAADAEEERGEAVVIAKKRKREQDPQEKRRYTYTMKHYSSHNDVLRHNSEEAIGTWKDTFQGIWEMHCALPGLFGQPANLVDQCTLPLPPSEIATVVVAAAAATTLPVPSSSSSSSSSRDHQKTAAIATNSPIGTDTSTSTIPQQVKIQQQDVPVEVRQSEYFSESSPQKRKTTAT